MAETAGLAASCGVFRVVRGRSQTVQRRVLLLAL